MPTIGRFPPFGNRFFRRARKLIGSCHFSHFWRIVVTLAAMQGRRSMSKIEAACRNHRTRQTIGFFLTQAHWDAPKVLAETAIDTLRSLPIEVLFKESKQYLGLGDYQMLRYRGIVRYLHLVLIAHLLLTHLGAAALGAQAESDKLKPLDIESVPRLQIILREKIWDDTINSMEKGSRNKRVGKKMRKIMLFKEIGPSKRDWHRRPVLKARA